MADLMIGINFMMFPIWPETKVNSPGSIERHDDAATYVNDSFIDSLKYNEKLFLRGQ